MSYKKIVILIILVVSTFKVSAIIITPIKFGAIPDGVTDCTESIRGMLRYMKSNNIYDATFPKGQYMIRDSIVIDFPCKLKGKNATIVSLDTLKHKYAFYFSYKRRGKEYAETPEDRTTEVSLNFKVHGIPMAFHTYNNIYVHDCRIGTFTGTDTYFRNTKFWFAIDCDKMYNAAFRNIEFDQPINEAENQFNSADGLHITGLCHDIVVDRCYGHCGDDFIALNANEDTPGDIYNIMIKNCKIGSDCISKNGIRIYGAAVYMNLSIYNVTIKNCTIRSSNSPSIYITNSADGTMNYKNNRLIVKNLIVKNCIFHCPRYELASKDNPSAIRIAGVDGESIRFEKIKAFSNNEMKSYFINILDINSLSDVNVSKSTFQGDNALDFFHLSDVVQNKSTLNNIVVNKRILFQQ